MTELLGAFARLAPIMVWAAVATAVTMVAAVVIERAEFGVQQALDRRLSGGTARWCSVRSRETTWREVAPGTLPRDIGSRSPGW